MAAIRDEGSLPKHIRSDSAVGLDDHGHNDDERSDQQQQQQANKSTTSTQPPMRLDEAILTRHSTRLYRACPVPQPVLDKALALAAHSNSNSNTQAWRLFLCRCFGAPVAGIVCMHRDLHPRAAFSVGMYVQTFLLALTEQGVGSCVLVSMAAYPDVVRGALGIPRELVVLCGVAIGYEDETAGVNQVRSDREAVDRTTVWVEE
ncbi:Nitroreductase-like protein [Xylariomycetidae sp. FL0641]|nr:Nitroreductase-like protein [Xylariomycetidae sp. FL0641]